LKKEKALILLSYIMVYLVWGSTYYFIKASVDTIPAPLVLSLRFLSGAVILAALAWKRGAFKTLPTVKEIAGSALLGVLLLLLGNGLLTIAEKQMQSYTASLIIACMPFYVALFNFILYRTGVSKIRFSGTVIGVLGIGFLLYNGTSFMGSISLSVLISIAGGLTWALGTSSASHLTKVPDVFLSTAIQMVTAGITATILAFATEPDVFGTLANASVWSWFSVFYLATLGSLTLVAYNFLLVKEPSFRISSYALVNPVIAVFIGLFAGEQATPYLVIGLPLVLAGLTLMLYGDAIKARISRGNLPKYHSRH
jgi:drug/metabolite transporter (DMT)-like permease